MNKKIICVDFDGVIHSYVSGWKGPRNIPDPPVRGAIRWLRDMIGDLGFSDAGFGEDPKIYCKDGRFEINIYSSRSKHLGGRFAMKKWLRHWFRKEGYGSVFVNFIRFPDKKPAAWLTIDDRCICFDGTFPSYEQVETFKPWYRKEQDDD